MFLIDFWQIFVTKISLDDFFKSKGAILKKKAIKIKNERFSFFADPFILRVKDKLNLLVEDFSFLSGAKISILEINKKKVYKTKILQNKHFSYPHNYYYNNKNYLFPEMSEESRNSFFQIKNKKKIKIKNYLLGYKVIDPTITKINGLYWLFCSLRDSEHSENKNLYLFYNKNLFDEWTAHKNNPVLKNDNKARPGGNIIKYKNNLFRPSQLNLKNKYGSELIINKILKISKNRYKEKKIFSIKPDKSYQGIHHLSYLNNYMAFDQKKIVYSIFKPLYYLLKSFK